MLYVGAVGVLIAAISNLPAYSTAVPTTTGTLEHVGYSCTIRITSPQIHAVEDKHVLMDMYLYTAICAICGMCLLVGTCTLLVLV